MARIRGADTAKSTSLASPLTASDFPPRLQFHKYLATKLPLLPRRFQAALERELTAAASDCVCIELTDKVSREEQHRQ